jgi:hypothetical protein
MNGKYSYKPQSRFLHCLMGFNSISSLTQIKLVFTQDFLKEYRGYGSSSIKLMKLFLKEPFVVLKFASSAAGWAGF